MSGKGAAKVKAGEDDARGADGAMAVHTTSAPWPTVVAHVLGLCCSFLILAAVPLSGALVARMFDDTLSLNEAVLAGGPAVLGVSFLVYYPGLSGLIRTHPGWWDLNVYLVQRIGGACGAVIALAYASQFLPSSF